MQGLAVGALVSASMSILGRVYNPGIRKTRVFSMMAAFSPFGFWIGCIQVGALSAHLPWIFGSTALLLTMCALGAQVTIPPLRPASDNLTSEAPSMRQFDYLAALLLSDSLWPDPWLFCSLESVYILHDHSWSFSVGGFYLVEGRVARPLIPPSQS